MNTFDIIILIILGCGAFKGYTRGFIVESLSFLAFFLGLFLALEFTIPTTEWLFGSTSYYEFASILIFITLFILLSLAIKAGAKVLKGIIDTTIFGTLDNIVGALAGVLKWIFVLSIIIWVFDSVGFDIEDRYAADAIIFPYIVDIGPDLFRWLSKIMPFIQDLIDSLENMPKKDDGLMTSIVTSINEGREKI